MGVVSRSDQHEVLLVFETETTRPFLKKKRAWRRGAFKIPDVNGTGKTSNNLLRASVARVSTYAPSTRNGGCSEKLIATTDCVWGPEDSRSRRLEVPRGRSLEDPRTRGPEAPRSSPRARKRFRLLSSQSPRAWKGAAQNFSSCFFCF